MTPATAPPLPIVYLITRELVRARTQHGLSLQFVADFAGYSVSALCAWENGTRRPSLDAVAAWAGALGYQLTLTEKKEGTAA